MNELSAAPPLHGARGREPVDEDGVGKAIRRLSPLVSDYPAIVGLDVDPLVATPDGDTAIDARLTADPDKL